MGKVGDGVWAAPIVAEFFGALFAFISWPVLVQLGVAIGLGITIAAAVYEVKKCVMRG